MSISSSNERLPNLPFGKLWLLAGVSLFLFIVSWNWFWFSKHVVPLPKDDAKLWSYHRRRVATESSVVLIGSSRIQIGFDQRRYAQLTGNNTIQLAIVGQSPIPILRNLAEDESFKGTVISDFSEYLIYQSEAHPDYFTVPNEWLKVYQESKTSDDFEFRLRGYAAYLIADPTLGENPPDALKNLMTPRTFEKQNIDKLIFGGRPIYFDRSMISMIMKMDDFLTEEMKKEIMEKRRVAPIAALRDSLDKSPPQPAEFLEIVGKIEGYVQKIQARGGRVIIVNFPMSGELERLNNLAFPRKYFWDVFAAKTSAKTIHFKDYPQLQFECPDGSHLDPKDTAQFTEGLVELIRSDLLR